VTGDDDRGELAGARAEIEHAHLITATHRLERPPDRCLGIVGAMLGVGGRLAAER